LIHSIQPDYHYFPGFIMRSSIHSPLPQSQIIQCSNYEKNQKSKYRVLLVDDDEDLLYVNQVFIERYEGFQVDTVSSVKMALEKLKQYSHNVIISDYDMPELNGIDFYKIVRSEGHITPFIIYSSKSRKEISLCHQIPDSLICLQKQTNVSQGCKELVTLIRQIIS